MNWIIPIAFLLILGSLGSALFFMMRDKGKSSKTVYSLMLRIGLSVVLFAGIWIAHTLGYIQSTGIRVSA
ncbi:MAG: hypothetical protein RL604_768 [Pseudomonadota bacterium]|jgi:hypothetical protein